MTPADAARVLAKAAAFDQRTVGKADAMAWAEALDDVEVGDALEAVTRHYRESEARIMPAHVRRHVEALRRERVRAAVNWGVSEGETCRHGTPNGTTEHPLTGRPLCALCRAEQGVIVRGVVE